MEEITAEQWANRPENMRKQLEIWESAHRSQQDRIRQRKPIRFFVFMDEGKSFEWVTYVPEVPIWEKVSRNATLLAACIVLASAIWG